ncbi:MAG: amidohydrolase, partial [Mariprofundaceae bacterium]
MIADHVFSDIHPESIYALHVYPYLPSGSLGLREGAMCAAADMFEVEITGRGGHAARPHECTDVILVASHIIQALHHIVSRRVNPLQAAVLTIGQIHGGQASNVIPEKVSFSGTFRSLQPETHEQIRIKMDRIIRQTAETWGAAAQFSLRQATPVLCNDDRCLKQARQIFQRHMPETSLI